MWVVVGGSVVRERRKRFRSAARNSGPVPCVIDWSREIFQDRRALLGERVSVGILVAHHDDCIAVDGELQAKS